MLSRLSFFYLWHFSTRCLPLSLSQYLSALLSLTSRRLFFCHWIFLSAAGLTSRCLLSCHRIFLSATKLTSRRISFPTFDICRCHWIGAYTSICASENPGIRLFANSHFFRASAHQGPYRIFCQGLLFLRHQLREDQHLFDWINWSPNSARVPPYSCWWGPRSTKSIKVKKKIVLV